MRANITAAMVLQHISECGELKHAVITAFTQYATDIVHNDVTGAAQANDKAAVLHFMQVAQNLREMAAELQKL